MKSKKPDYCINDLVESCQECCYKNYGLDCQNNKIEEEEEKNDN